MDDYSLVPIDYKPNFENYSLVPVPYNPFSDTDGPQQPPTQPAHIPIQSPPTQPQVQQAQAQLSTVPEPSDHGLSERQKLSPIEKALNPITSYPKTYERMRNSALDFATAGIDQIRHHDSLRDPQAHGLSDVLSGAARAAIGSAGYVSSPLTAAYRSIIGQPVEDITGIPREYTEFATQLATPGVGLARLSSATPAVGGSSAVRAAANELRADVALPRTPAVRAAEKGYPGIGTTTKGGPTHAGTDYLYPAGPGQQSVVRIKLTGSRRDDFELANSEGKFTETPDNYVWHHLDDFNPQNGEATLELIDKEAHKATMPHTGSVAQYEKYHGVRYKR